MSRKYLACALGWGMIGLLAVAWCGCVKEQAKAPLTSKRPVASIYHGVEVVDDYQWLEDKDDPVVREWTALQNEYARSYLDGLPRRAELASRLEALYRQSSPDYYGFAWVGGKLFAMKEDPATDQPMLVVMDSPHDLTTERTVINPNALDTTGLTAIDYFVVSPDARMVAVSLSVGGTEDGDAHVYSVADGQALPDLVPRVNGPTAGGDMAWAADVSGFYYSRYPRAGERPADSLRFYQQVYFHRLGEPTDKDTYEIGKEFPAIAEIEFETSADGRYLIAVVADGDGGEFAHYLKGPSGDWRQITQFSDLIPTVEFGPDYSLYMLSHKDAPRGKILRLAPGVYDLGRAEVMVPESEAVIEGFVPTTGKLYTSEVVGGPSQMRLFDPSGKYETTVPILPVSAVGSVTALDGDRILFRNQSYTEPPACFTYQPGDTSASRTAIFVTSPADFSDVEVVREFAVSKDGTRVPLNVMRRKGTPLNGQNPTILYGYGGYGSIQSPDFDKTISLWLEQGGVYAEANLRGGGEFGEEWHLAGNLVNKQNVFDDFAACARHLIDTGYTNPSRLAIRGGSNGGLLVSATMVQNPELFKAVVCQKGLHDMLRVELDANGAFNVTEFGTVENPEQFKALYAYSPYHNVKAGVHYPDIFMNADENDGRVLSYHSKKMTARLQAVSPQSLTLLRVSAGLGHNIGSSLTDDIALNVDVYSFLFDRLGVTYTPRP